MIRDEPRRRAVCIEHRGPSFMIGRAFGELGAWLEQSGTDAGHYLAIFYDDAETSPAEQRSDAGAFVPDGFATDDPRVHVVEVDAGTYAVATHPGPYDGLPSAWTALIEQWLPASGYELRDAPSFEVYVVSDMADRPALRTELCLPVRAPAG